MKTKKTKIVATIGPKSDRPETIESLIKAGVNVFRFNFSHGTKEENVERMKQVTLVREKLGLPVALLADLCGPKIRTGELSTDTITLKKGSELVLTTTPCVGNESRLFIQYNKLPSEVEVGQVIFLDDGKVKLVVKNIVGNDITCRVLVGSTIRSRRGVNVPGAKLSLSSLTAKDKVDLKAALKAEADFVALSFVQTVDDIKELRRLLKSEGKSEVKIIAKIETELAIKNIDGIIENTDALMIARGDLAIEVPVEEVPILQKMIIKKCIAAGVPVITATQMHESMVTSPVPTRAEAADVANAVFDGTDAVMLSQETAMGDHPVLVVETMSKIAVRAEESVFANFSLSDAANTDGTVFAEGTADAIGYAAVNVAYDVNAAALVALTVSGKAARMLSRHRSGKPIVVLTPTARVYQQAALSFGCKSVMMPYHLNSVVEAVNKAKETLLAHKLLKKGETVVITGGVPFGHANSTNLLLVQTL